MSHQEREEQRGGSTSSSAAKQDVRGTKRALEAKQPIYVVEHMEEGLEEWCTLEYKHICSIIPTSRVLFLRFPSGPDPQVLVAEGSEPPKISSATLEEGSCPGSQSVLPAWDRVCLMDMQADEALEPTDAAKFDAFIFGGILGNVIENDDGSYGSDDRTCELRRLNFRHRRHLGPMQMTTDTAVLVSHMVLEEGKFLCDIPTVDSPEIGADEQTMQDGPQDTICMEGFRYVVRRGSAGEWEPVLPPGMKELLLRSADDNILDSMA
mmetsp:Transcript_3520/g.8766  ORF Transcript_3520/g.8766 Transcript_3520/m.8766 type:complete len:265 (+) Transcript_3520:49-843(+)